MTASIPKASCAPRSCLLQGSTARAGRLDHHPAGRQELPARPTSAPSSARSARRCSRFRIEAAYSKDKILELYLNEIYLGLGNYGVAAAALNYFGKSVHELTIAEAAYLAALPKAPNNYHPVPEARARASSAATRSSTAWSRTATSRARTARRRRASRSASIRACCRRTPIAAGYFAEEVRRELGDRYGEKKLYEGGLSVRTTLDPKMQLMARKALVDGLVRYDEAHGWRGAMQPHRHSARTGACRSPTCRHSATSQPWRLAVVLDANDARRAIGLQPRPREIRRGRPRARNRHC